MSRGRTNPFSYMVDAIEIAFLASVLLIGWPLASFRSLSSQCDLRFRLKALGFYGLLSNVAYCIWDYRFARWELVIANLECMIARLEDVAIPPSEHQFLRHGLLEDFYAALVRVHIVRGCIEDAALTLIQANRRYGFERFKGIKDFDLKTAQIIKAAVAASSLIGDGGVAQVIVETTPAHKQSTFTSPGMRPSARTRHVLAKTDHSAKVIPFPARN